MIRCTIEILPGGLEGGRRTLGVIEIARTAILPGNYGEYTVILKKNPPFKGALYTAWRRGRLTAENIASEGENEDDEVIVTRFGGFHRTRRGVYDLLYRALRGCGLEARNPSEDKKPNE